MEPRIIARNEVEAAALRYIESLVARRIPAQGRYARRGRYVASSRPAFRRPAIA